MNGRQNRVVEGHKSCTKRCHDGAVACDRLHLLRRRKDRHGEVLRKGLVKREKRIESIRGKHCGSGSEVITACKSALRRTTAHDRWTHLTTSWRLHHATQ
jgi:hypothetical protein